MGEITLWGAIASIITLILTAYYVYREVYTKHKEERLVNKWIMESIAPNGGCKVLDMPPKGSFEWLLIRRLVLENKALTVEDGKKFRILERPLLDSAVNP